MIVIYFCTFRKSEIESRRKQEEEMRKKQEDEDKKTAKALQVMLKYSFGQIFSADVEKNCLTPNYKLKQGKIR